MCRRVQCERCGRPSFAGCGRHVEEVLGDVPPAARCNCTHAEKGTEGAMFKKNESGIDRAVRVVLGLSLLALAFVGPKSPWGFIGLVPLLTGVVGFCPAYKLLGMSTCRTR